ncbi:MAG: hypothetical protein ACREM3_29965 [Candidatus Rokuibacteriota bacterium]
MARALAILVAVTMLALPSIAAACPSCLSSAYGDRTFNWAFLGMIAMPFVVAAAIGGTLLYRYRVSSAPGGSRPRAPEPPHFAAPEERS